MSKPSPEAASSHAPTHPPAERLSAPVGETGKRGRNRAGYYLALLYALELHYRLEHQAKKSPLHWQPLPRHRPDQFMGWLMEGLELLGGLPPSSFGELLERLRGERLAHVADGLRTVVERRLLGTHSNARGRAQLRGLSLKELRMRFGGSPKRERHPQARKFARLISRNLDSIWRKALILTVSDGERGWPPSALLLGALPPSFTVISDHIFARLEGTDLPAEPAALTVLQFYGLATGTLPPAPAPWREGLEALLGLGDEELALLGSLSDHQVKHIRTLSEEAVALLLRPGGQHLRERTGSLDEEVAHMVKRGELTPRLLERLQGWSGPHMFAMRALLGENAPWAMACLQDWALLSEWFAARTRARLDLRDLFPESIAWLDGYLGRHLEDAALQSVGDLEPFATAISQHIQQHLLEQAGMEHAQLNQGKTS